MQALGRQPHRAPAGAPVQYERHRPEQTAMYRLVQQHAQTFFAQTEEATGASLPLFFKDEFDAFLGCGILAHGFLRLRCDDCGHDKLVASTANDTGFAPPAALSTWRRPHRIWSTTSSRMCRCVAVTADLVAATAGRTAQAGDAGAVGGAFGDHAPPARLSRAAGRAGRQRRGHADQALWCRRQSDIHQHCLVFDGMYQRADGEPHFVEVPAPSDEVLQALLHKIIARLMKLLIGRDVLVEEEESSYLADSGADSDDARALRPL